MTQRPETNKAMLVLGLFVIVVAVAMFLGVFGISVSGMMWGPLAGEHHWLRVGPVFSLLGLGTLLQAFLAVWVGLDANRRGMNGLLWGLLVLFTFVVGLLVYLIVAQTTANGSRADPGTGQAAADGSATAAAMEASATKREGTRACEQCAGKIEAGFRVCPHCGTSLTPSCPACGRPTEPGWKVCPYCSTALTT